MVILISQDSPSWDFQQKSVHQPPCSGLALTEGRCAIKWHPHWDVPEVRYPRVSFAGNAASRRCRLSRLMDVENHTVRLLPFNIEQHKFGKIKCRKLGKIVCRISGKLNAFFSGNVLAVYTQSPFIIKALH